MARSFRFWVKKRGKRRTGSPWLGGVGEALFYAALTLLGTMALAGVITAQVLYSTSTQSYFSGLTLVFTLLVVLAFMLIGASGVASSAIHVGASAERRSALAKKATEIDLLRDSTASNKEYPNVPRDSDLTNSPGIKLAYRLPMDQSSNWKFFGTAIFWLCSIGTASALCVWAIDGFRADRVEPFRVLVATPFVLIAIATTYYFTHLLLMHTRVGPTNVEVSNHPLYPGHCYRASVSQAGALAFRWLQFDLVCEEEATFEQGTDIRTEVQPVYSHRLLREERFEIQPGSPFEKECQITVPTEAMHSFKSTSNAVHWKLVVRGAASGWPEFHRSFHVIVYPPKPVGD